MGRGEPTHDNDRDPHPEGFTMDGGAPLDHHSGAKVAKRIPTDDEVSAYLHRRKQELRKIWREALVAAEAEEQELRKQARKRAIANDKKWKRRLRRDVVWTNYPESERKPVTECPICQSRYYYMQKTGKGPRAATHVLNASQPHPCPHPFHK